MFTGIDKSASQVVDVAKEIAELIYSTASGVMAHSVSLRIYESAGEIKLDKAEEDFLMSFVQSSTTPKFQDSFKANLKDDGEVQ